MSLLNRPSDGLASVLLALRRTLLAYGPQPEGRLLNLCAPSSVTTDADMARKTLNRWKQLGAFAMRGDVVHLRPEVSSVGADDLDTLRAVLLQLVLTAQNNPEFVQPETARDSDEGSLARDFTRAAAWTLGQDIYRFGGRWEELQTAQGIRPLAFANDTRWVGFVDWSTFLGIGYKHRGGLVLDPAFAVRSVLGQVFNGASELSQENFLERLADALPILDAGRYRIVVEQQVSRPWRSLARHEISPSLSTALLHLEASGALRLETRADAPQRLMTGRGGQEVRSFSHVVLSEAD